MIQPSVGFCMVWSNAFVDLQCFDWSEQKRVFFFFSKKSPVQQSNGTSQTWKEWFYTKASDRIFSSFTTRKGSLTAPNHRTDRTRRSQRWRKRVRQNHRQKPGRFGPFDWSQCSLPVKCVTTRDLEVVTLFVGDEPKMATICQFAPQKSRVVSAKWGTFFFWGQLNEMQWLTVLPKKCVHFHVFISSVGTRNFCLVYFLRGHLNICRYILIHTDT